jgi:hypothetical protein
MSELMFESMRSYDAVTRSMIEKTEMPLFCRMNQHGMMYGAESLKIGHMWFKKATCDAVTLYLSPKDNLDTIKTFRVPNATKCLSLYMLNPYAISFGSLYEFILNIPKLEFLRIYSTEAVVLHTVCDYPFTERPDDGEPRLALRELWIIGSNLGTMLVMKQCIVLLYNNSIVFEGILLPSTHMHQVSCAKQSASSSYTPGADTRLQFKLILRPPTPLPFDNVD